MLAFPNVGYIGIPLINSIYGPSATIYVAIFILLFNIVIYTYGIALLKGKTGKRFSSENLKSILNMGTISCLVTLLFLFLEFPYRRLWKTPITFWGIVPLRWH
jgi:predicted permease